MQSNVGNIDKLLRIRKKMGLPKERFILCATDLDDAQVQSLSAMYEMSFVNLGGLLPHLTALQRG